MPGLCSVSRLTASASRREKSFACYPAAVKRPPTLLAAAAAALVALGATAVLPARVEQVAHAVEQVRGRRFQSSVPASEIEPAELKRILRAKLAESFPTAPEDMVRTLVAFGLIDETPKLLDRLVEFYASQVIAFYDPEPRRFFVVHGASGSLEGEEPEALTGVAEKLIFAHELTHALQDETLRLDRRLKDLKDNGDRALALECLLEGEATLVMVRVATAELPGSSEDVEEMLAPLLSAGALEKSNVPKDIPEYFVDQLFFPYVDGTAFVRAQVKKGGWPAIDRLWKEPPTSSSEILHPGTSFSPASDLLPGNLSRLAPPGQKFLYSDTLGEWTVRFVLRRGLEQAEADAAASGWRGDRIAFYGSPGSVGYVWRVRFESSAAAERFETAWKKARALRKELIARTGPDVLVAAGFEKIPQVR